MKNGVDYYSVGHKQIRGKSEFRRRVTELIL